VAPVVVTETLDVIREDPDDHRVLECGWSGSADAVVTGDRDLLQLREFRGILLLSPREFLERFG
jgi:predicted nucleic acid-binding protein